MLPQYIDDALAQMENLDWSRYSDLTDVSSGAIKAAAYVRWLLGDTEVDQGEIIVLLRRFYGFFSDESSLASAEDDTRAFMDKADELKLGAFVLDTLNREVAKTVINRYRGEGWLVGELKNLGSEFFVEASEEGFYVFTDGRT